METLQLDKTRFHFIWRGAVVGVIAGFVISLFRLCIENMLKIVKIVFSAGFEKPIWMLLLFLFFIVAWLVKNVALLVGIVEAIVKVIAGIVSLTPTKKDDAFLPKVDAVASAIKKALYWTAEKLAGKV